MFNVVLFQPEIPPNTGNIIRLCANMGAKLHLIHPLGFSLTEKQVKRAGLDYHLLASLKEYPSFEDFLDTHQTNRIFPISTKGQHHYHTINFVSGDTFLFGPETRGLPDTILKAFPEHVLRIPMTQQSRSLNLSNSVGIILYEAWRQIGFIGAI